MTNKLAWLDSHIGNIDDAKDLINRFCWSLEVAQKEGTWYVTTGDAEKHVIFSADSRESVDAFLYGMGLAYAGIPGHLFDQLEKDIKAWIANL